MSIAQYVNAFEHVSGGATDARRLFEWTEFPLPQIPLMRRSILAIAVSSTLAVSCKQHGPQSLRATKPRSQVMSTVPSQRAPKLSSSQRSGQVKVTSREQPERSTRGRKSVRMRFLIAPELRAPL